MLQSATKLAGSGSGSAELLEQTSGMAVTACVAIGAPSAVAVAVVPAFFVATGVRVSSTVADNCELSKVATRVSKGMAVTVVLPPVFSVGTGVGVSSTVVDSRWLSRVATRPANSSVRVSTSPKRSANPSSVSSPCAYPTPPSRQDRMITSPITFLM